MNAIRTLGKLADATSGTASRLIWAFRGTQDDTRADLAPYLDRVPEEIFPAPMRDPIATVRAARTLFGRRVDHVTFASDHVPFSTAYARRHHDDYEANLQVHLRWWHRQKPRKRAILYVHGWMEPGEWLEEATLFPIFERKLDADLVHVTLPFHGRRKTRGALFHGERYWTADVVRTLEAVRQSVIDIRSAMRWMRARGYEEVGVTGVSLGGALTMVTACLEPTPDWIVPIVGHLDVGDAIEHAPILWRVKKDLARFGLDARQRLELVRRTGLVDLKPKLAKEKQVWIAAKDDAFLRAECVERQWEAWGRPRCEWIEGGHMTFMLAMPTILRAIEDARRG